MHVLMDVCEIYHIIDLSFVIAYIYGIHMLYWTMCGGSKYITIHRITTRSFVSSHIGLHVLKRFLYNLVQLQLSLHE